MNSEQIAGIKECSALSKAGKIGFGDVVGKLIGLGIERYHADYSRGEISYYLPGGESLVLAMEVAVPPIAEDFSATQVEASVRQSQRGEIWFPQFVVQTAGAGCVGYFVQITGKCVQYFGRKGEMHTERFPGAK